VETTQTSTISVSKRHVELKDQLRDYQYRGKGLSAHNLYDFVVNTYEIVLRDEDQDTNRLNLNQGRRGRPRSERIPYLEGAGKL
jgi:hypothetical protein